MTTKTDRLSIGGVAHVRIDLPTEHVPAAVVEGMFANPTGRGVEHGKLVTYHDDGSATIEAHLHNAFVDQGLQGILDSAFGDLTADRITHIGLSGDTAAVTAATTTIGTPNSIKTTANTARTDETVAADQTWTQADVAFAITKIGFLRGSAATDVSNIIGGTGGSSPYDEEFTIDLTSVPTWTLTMGIEVTASAS